LISSTASRDSTNTLAIVSKSWQRERERESGKERARARERARACKRRRKKERACARTYARERGSERGQERERGKGRKKNQKHLLEHMHVDEYMHISNKQLLKVSMEREYPMGWLRLVGSLKVQVCCAKEPYKRDDILQKRRVI